jgi:CRISPR-associated endoribonuclease Cas6
VLPKVFFCGGAAVEANGQLYVINRILGMNENLIQLRMVFDVSAREVREKHRVYPWDIGPLLQGVLMEKIDSRYATQLHAQTFNPYSQYCCAADEQLVWVVNTLTSEAYHSIIPVLADSRELYLRGLGLGLNVVKREQLQLSRTDLAAMIHGSTKKRHKVQIVTPASFKQAGNYQILPDLRLMLQNLLMHYGQLYDDSREVDQETVAYLVEHTKISQYNLASRGFRIAGKSVPAFMGMLTIDVRGPAPVIGLVHMLLQFGEYSGMGIKTAMGMGGIKLLD